MTATTSTPGGATTTVRPSTGKLFSYVLEISPLVGGWVRRLEGSQPQALFYQLLRVGNPEQAAAIHDSGRRAPFTVSPILASLDALPPTDRDKILVHPEGRYYLRFTFLDDTLFGPFVRALEAQGNVFTVGGVEWKIMRVLTTLKETPWARTSSLSDLDQLAHPSKYITLEFFTPTAFANNAGEVKRSVILPDMCQVWRSLGYSWRTAGGEFKAGNGEKDFTLDQIVGYVMHDMAISDLSLKVDNVSFTGWGDVYQRGFTGRVTFMLVRNDPAYSRVVNMLADFALFAGVGVKAGAGMGQVRKVAFSSGKGDTDKA